MASSREATAQEVVQVELPAPAGWKKQCTPKAGRTGKRKEIVFISPDGEEIRNKRRLDQYLKQHPGGPLWSEFDWGAGDTPRRSARLSVKSKAAETSEDEEPNKRQKNATGEGEVNNNGGDDFDETPGQGADADASETNQGADKQAKDAQDEVEDFVGRGHDETLAFHETPEQGAYADDFAETPVQGADAGASETNEAADKQVKDAEDEVEDYIGRGHDDASETNEGAYKHVKDAEDDVEDYIGRGHDEALAFHASVVEADNWKEPVMDNPVDYSEEHVASAFQASTDNADVPGETGNVEPVGVAPAAAENQPVESEANTINNGHPTVGGAPCS